MNLLVKHRGELIIFLILLVVYFLLRLPNLTLQPIFADEAIYIRWAQVMRSEPTLRFLPLSDGKTPLFMWSMIPLFKIFDDPLFAGRFLSVMSGLATLAGVFALGWRVFGLKVGLWSVLLYTIVPYTVFFDRMALVDSMLSAFTIWALFFAIWLAQRVRLDLAMILGYLLGGAILTKTPGMLNLFLVPLTTLAFKRSKADRYHLVKLIIFWAVAIMVALIIYNGLRLGPNFHLLSSRNADYVFSPIELIGRPLDPFIPHFRDIADWFPKLFTWPVLIFGVIGVIVVIREKSKMGIVVLLWAIIPILLSMAFFKTYTARYLLPSIPVLLVLAGVGVEKVSQVVKVPRVPWGLKPVVLVILVILLPFNFNFQLLTNPPPKFLPEAERKGYFEMWTAGYGFREIAQYLVEQKRQEDVVVGTEGFFGTLPDGLYIYLDKSGISVVGSTATISAQIKNAAKDHLTFFVGNKSNLSKIGGVEKVLEFPKTGSDATVLYKVLP